jgi:hypothetical protein
VTTFNAEAAGVRRDDVIEMLAKHVKPTPPNPPRNGNRFPVRS